VRQVSEVGHGTLMILYIHEPEDVLPSMPMEPKKRLDKEKVVNETSLIN